MRLKTQFHALTIASIAMTIVVAILLTIAANRAGILSGPGRQFILLRARLERAVDKGVGEKGLCNMVRNAKGVDAILEDGGFARIAWNFPEAEGIDLRGDLESSRFPAGITTARIGSPGRYYYVSAVQTQPGDFKSGFVSSQTSRMILVLILLLASPLFMSVFLNRTMRALRSLQEATRRISSGDLGYRPDIAGPDEIAALASSFDEMRISLREESERRARFLMSISHDLKSPLTALRGYIEALKDGHGASAEERERYLSIIERKSMLLESRIREIVNYISLSTSDWQLSLKPVELRECLEALASEFRDEASVFGRAFESRIELAGGVRAMLDRQLFGRCLENIVSNAIKFTPEGGRISMRCDQAGGKAKLVFSDDGPGISEADKARVFEPFYRGEAAARIQGMGLGLSIVKSIMEAHGFAVSLGVDAGTAKGTVIVIAIPIIEGKAAGA